MRQLLLLRHAKSSWDDAAQPDHARPLNARGRTTAATLRTVLGEARLAPDVILVSSARRTLQTLEALAPWDETPLIEMMDSLYLAEPRQILHVLGGVTETVRSVLVIGHNPGLHELALQLCGEHALSSNGNMARQLAQGFPTAGLAEFAVAQSWHDLAAHGQAGQQGSGRLVRFIRPTPPPGGEED